MPTAVVLQVSRPAAAAAAAAAASVMNVLKCKFSGLIPDPLNGNCWDENQQSVFLISPPGNWDARGSLRMTNLHQHYKILVASHIPVLVFWLMHLFHFVF